jgi:hypothetical protein
MADRLRPITGRELRWIDGQVAEQQKRVSSRFDNGADLEHLDMLQVIEAHLKRDYLKGI